MKIAKIKTVIKRMLVQSHLFSEKTINRTRKHWIRVICDEETEKLVLNIKPESLAVLEISGRRWEKVSSFKSYEHRNYPEFDILNIENYLKTYDMIILEHVLEHISNPLIALKNIHKLLNPKGYILLTTPFLVKIHFAPEDYTRWSKTGLKQIMIDTGFDLNKIIVGQWGNINCIKANFTKWVKYNPFLHSLKNDDKFPAVIWCLARKY